MIITNMNNTTINKLKNTEYANRKRTPIDYFDLQGNYLGTAKSYNDAQLVTGAHKENILKVIKGRLLSTHGFRFSYHNNNNINGIGPLEKTRPSGPKLKTDKPIYQYTLNGEYLNEYKNHIEVEKILGFNASNILKCAKGESGTSHGYIWSFEGKNSINPRRDKTKYPKKIYQFDLEGNYLNEYESCQEALIAIGKPNGRNIFKTLKGERKSAHGFIWKYADGDLSIKKYEEKPSASKPILIYDTKDDKYYSFESQAQCVRESNISACLLSKALKTQDYKIFDRYTAQFIKSEG